MASPALDPGPELARFREYLSLLVREIEPRPIERGLHYKARECNSLAQLAGFLRYFHRVPGGVRDLLERIEGIVTVVVAERLQDAVGKGLFRVEMPAGF
jgi:hypothetical protein